jgi:hypothetical protein
MRTSLPCRILGFVFTFILALGTAAFPQQPASISPDDATAIQALVSSYARALGGCRAEEFADLFAPDAGYFASGIRGQIVGRERLIALVQSERHARRPPAPRQRAPRRHQRTDGRRRGHGIRRSRCRRPRRRRPVSGRI